MGKFHLPPKVYEAISHLLGKECTCLAHVCVAAYQMRRWRRRVLADWRFLPPRPQCLPLNIVHLITPRSLRRQGRINCEELFRRFHGRWSRKDSLSSVYPARKISFACHVLIFSEHMCCVLVLSNPEFNPKVYQIALLLPINVSAHVLFFQEGWLEIRVKLKLGVWCCFGTFLKWLGDYKRWMERDKYLKILLQILKKRTFDSGMILSKLYFLMVGISCPPAPKVQGYLPSLFRQQFPLSLLFPWKRRIGAVVVVHHCAMSRPFGSKIAR